MTDSARFDDLDQRLQTVERRVGETWERANINTDAIAGMQQVVQGKGDNGGSTTTINCKFREISKNARQSNTANLAILTRALLKVAAHLLEECDRRQKNKIELTYL